jgi:adhesin/invasin
MTWLWVLSAVTVAMVVACDKVPLTSPTGSTISLSIDRETLPIGGTATVIAVVTESAGTAVHNGTMVTFQTTSGRMDPIEAPTVNGKATSTFIGGVSGTAVINAFSGAARTGSGNSSAGGVSIKVGTAAAERVSVRTEPANIPVSGGTVTVVAGLYDAGGNPISNTPVSISADFGTLSSNTATTDANGEARVTLTTNRTTTITVTAGAKTQPFTLNALNPPTVTLQCGGSTNTAATVGLPISCTIAATAAGNATSSAPIVNLTVNWGDGTGEQPLGVNGSTTVSHTYTSTGSFVVTAAATDGNSQRGTAVLTLNVTRSIPSISISGPTSGTGTAGSPVTFTVVPPTPSATGIPTANVTVNFGDGTSRDLGAITASTAVLKTYSSTGIYNVSATVTDTAGGRNTASTAIQIGQGTPPTVTLTHDSAPANNNVDEVFTVGATTTNGTITNIRVTLGDGTVIYSGAAGSFTWKPNGVGVFTLTATATDTGGNSGSKILQVTVQP